MFALFEPHVLEALAPVQALIDAVTIAHVTPADIFAGAHPEGVTVAGIDANATEGVGTVFFEDRLPRGTGIDRLPEVAGTGGHVPGVGRLAIDGNIRNTPGHQGRPDAA